MFAGERAEKKAELKESNPLIPCELLKATENESVIAVSPSIIAYTHHGKAVSRDEYPTADVVIYDTMQKKVIRQSDLFHPAVLVAMPDRTEEFMAVYTDKLEFAVYNYVTGVTQ